MKVGSRVLFKSYRVEEPWVVGFITSMDSYNRYQVDHYYFREAQELVLIPKRASVNQIKALASILGEYSTISEEWNNARI